MLVQGFEEGKKKKKKERERERERGKKKRKKKKRDTGFEATRGGGSERRRCEGRV